MSSLDYSQEPEKIWKASLLKHQNEAFYFLFFENGKVAKSWEIMVGWIGTLNETSQKALSKITEKLEGAIFDRQSLTSKESYQLFRQISNHVYNCYLSQAGFGMIQTSALPTGSGPKAPEKKPYDKVKATL